MECKRYAFVDFVLGYAFVRLRTGVYLFKGGPSTTGSPLRKNPFIGVSPKVDMIASVVPVSPQKKKKN